MAPMEGVTDGAFRRMCKTKGADVLISEFISSDALSREVDKSIRKMDFEESERPFGVQIFGKIRNQLLRVFRHNQSLRIARIIIVHIDLHRCPLHTDNPKIMPRTFFAETLDRGCVC